jgi:uncharacterized UPF0160 family protein
MEFQYTKGITHAGKFHADDVFSTAFLMILNPDIVIERTFDVPENIDEETTIVFDIGRGKFDHHQAESKVRENNIPYAAFGLLWKEFGKLIFPEKKLVDKFDEKFVSEMDLSDNTGTYHQLSAIISSFNPLWNENKSEQEQFFKAVDFAKKILVRQFAQRKAIGAAYLEVKAAYEKSDKQIVIMDRYAPWKNALLDTEALFVVFPSNRGGFNAICIPVSDVENQPRVKFPEQWAGLEEEELYAVTGIKELLFCHKNLFMIHTKTVEAAVKAAKTAIKADIKK